MNQSKFTEEINKLESKMIRIFGFNYLCKRVKISFVSMANKTLADADSGTHEIRVNKNLFHRLSIEEQIDTLRHEYAHIASFIDMKNKNGYPIEISRKGYFLDHGKNWKYWAKSFGAIPRACSTHLKPKHQFYCTGCKIYIGGYQRLPSKVKKKVELGAYTSKCCNNTIKIISE